MKFEKGKSGNPGGRKKSIGLSRAVRKSQGLKSWAWLCKAGNEEVLERKEIGKDKDGKPILVDVVPSVKVLADVHKLILAYCWGQPTQKVDFGDEGGKSFGFAVLMHPDAEKVLKDGQRTESTEAGADSVGFDFGS
jgi:hypothetical protein